MMGDTVLSDGKDIEIRITAGNLKNAELYLVTAKREVRICPGTEKIAPDEVFAYVKAVGKLNQIISVTNPVYIR